MTYRLVSVCLSVKCAGSLRLMPVCLWTVHDIQARVCLSVYRVCRDVEAHVYLSVNCAGTFRLMSACLSLKLDRHAEAHVYLSICKVCRHIEAHVCLSVKCAGPGAASAGAHPYPRH